MTPRITARLALCFAVSALLALASCTKQGTVPAGGSYTGTYTLVSVNGKNVTASISHDGMTMRVVSGSFVINADGTCSSKSVFVPPSGSETERNVNATYTKDGTTLTMQWQGAGRTVGTVQGDTFTMDNHGMVFVYRK